MDVKKVKSLLEDLKREIEEVDNEDLEQYGILKLRDGLTIEKIRKKYSWILEASIEGAIIGEDSKGLVWYNGIWEDGDWDNGTWKNGWWNNGIWWDGKWEFGTWIDGVWNKGKWLEGFDNDGNYHGEDDSPNKWEE